MFVSLAVDFDPASGTFIRGTKSSTMRSVIRSVLSWDSRSDEDRKAMHKRFDKLRYWIFFVLSFPICLLPIPLGSLFAFTLSDKQAKNGHQYGWAYNRNFFKFKYRRTKILEIGIGGYDYSLGGQSLNSWQCFFPFGRIIGADIKDASALQNFRTKIYRIDQSDKASLLQMADIEKKFDIIVDDGSHMNAHQLLTFATLFDHLRDGGVYVLEDVQTSYWHFAGWDGSRPEDEAFRETCVGYFLWLAKYLNHAEIAKNEEQLDHEVMELAKSVRSVEFHHNLIFVHKGRNDHPSNIMQ